MHRYQILEFIEEKIIGALYAICLLWTTMEYNLYICILFGVTVMLHWSISKLKSKIYYEYNMSNSFLKEYCSRDVFLIPLLSLNESDFYIQDSKLKNGGQGLYCKKHIFKNQFIMPLSWSHLSTKCNDIGITDKDIEALKTWELPYWDRFLKKYNQLLYGTPNTIIARTTKRNAFLYARMDIPPHTELTRLYGSPNWFFELPITQKTHHVIQYFFPLFKDGPYAHKMAQFLDDKKV